MTQAEILRLLQTDGSLHNARYYKDSVAAANHITQHHAPVTAAEVKPVMDSLLIHPGTGAVMDAS